MDKTILPAKYIDCVKTLVYSKKRKQYELSLAIGVIADSRYFEATSKKAVLNFLRHKMYYKPWLYKAKYARDTVNTINRYRFNIYVSVQVSFNLKTNEFLTDINVCNNYCKYSQDYIIPINNYQFLGDNKIDKDMLINDTIQALYKHFCQ